MKKKAETNKVENRNKRKLIKQKMLEGRKIVLMVLNHILLESGLKINIISGPVDPQDPFFTSQKSG